MTSISTFLPGGVFEPHDIRAMSMALDDVCKTLNLNDLNAKAARQVVAERIIALAQEGERSPTRLRDKLLRECGFSEAEPKTPPRWSGL